MSSSLFRAFRCRPLQQTVRWQHKTAIRHPRRIKVSQAVAASATIALTTYTVGALYPPTPATLISPRSAPGPPDPNLPSSIAYTEALENELNNLRPLTTLRNQPDAEEWYETRPFLHYPEERRVNSLTAGALRGPGKLALAPLVRARKDETENVIFLHVGRGLCGHDGIVHGGLLATLLDEGLARVAIQNLPEKIGVTANLSINYRAPARADQFLILRTRLVEAKGRKAVVSGRLEDAQGNLLTDATAVFVQPRYAKLLNASAIRSAIGGLSDPPILPVGETPNPLPPTTSAPQAS